MPGHGRFFVGDPQGFSFRTDRCVRDWADTPIASAVYEAWWWLKRGVLSAFAGDPARLPAVVLDGLILFESQREVAKEDADRDAAEEEARIRKEQGYEVTVFRRKVGDER